MCLQCVTNPYYYGSPFPGWYLIRARRSACGKEMGVKSGEGDYPPYQPT